MTSHSDDQVPARDEAIAVLWQQHHAGLVRLAVGLTGEIGAAEEIVQDAFAALLRRWRRLRDPAAGHAYLQRVVVHGARGQWRRRQRLGQAVMALTPRPASADDPDIDSQLARRARTAVARQAGVPGAPLLRGPPAGAGS